MRPPEGRVGLPELGALKVWGWPLGDRRLLPHSLTEEKAIQQA